MGVNFSKEHPSASRAGSAGRLLRDFATMKPPLGKVLYLMRSSKIAACIFICGVTLWKIEATAKEIENTEWFSDFRVPFAAYTCQKTEYFRRCYEVEKAEC